MRCYEMSEIQRALSITPALLMRLYRARLLPEFDDEQTLYRPGVYFKWGGTGGGRLWTPHGVVRLFVSLHLLKAGLDKRTIVQALSMIFEGVSNEDGPLPRTPEEYERTLRRRIIEREGERKFFVINPGYLAWARHDREYIATGRVVTQGEDESEYAEVGKYVIPIREVVCEIRLGLMKAGLSGNDFRLEESD